MTDLHDTWYTVLDLTTIFRVVDLRGPDDVAVDLKEIHFLPLFVAVCPLLWKSANLFFLPSLASPIVLK